MTRFTLSVLAATMLPVAFTGASTSVADEIQVHTGPRARIGAEIRIARTPPPRVLFVPASLAVPRTPVTVVRGPGEIRPQSRPDLFDAMAAICNSGDDPVTAEDWDALLPVTAASR